MKTNVCYQGDCLEVMKGIEDNSIDMILADLPYGTTACKWDTIIPFEPLWEHYKRIIKPNGAIVLTASQPFTSALVMSNIKMFKYEWIWDKNIGANFLNSKFQPLKVHENILVFSNGGITNGSKEPVKYNPQDLVEINKINKNSNNPTAPKTFSDNGRMSDKNSCLQPNKEYFTKYTNYPKSITQVFKKEDVGKHPTQKPVALFEYLIKTYTNEGDLVLDNTAGSGTTGVACKNLNRNFILIEQDEKYCEVIKERVGCEIIKPVNPLDCLTDEFKATGKSYGEGIANKLIELQKEKQELIKRVLDKCPKCNGRFVKTKYGMTCEDCLEDF